MDDLDLIPIAEDGYENIEYDNETALSLEE
jgi:hypothetical protein